MSTILLISITFKENPIKITFEIFEKMYPIFNKKNLFFNQLQNIQFIIETDKRDSTFFQL